MSEADRDLGTAGDERSQGEPGARLRSAREAHELGIQAAAESLGVPGYVLEALEGNDWERLEAPVYVRGYLRKYARLLGLPEDEIVSAYEASANPHDPDVRAHATSALPRRNNVRWLAPATIGIAAIILVLVAIWGWHRLHRRSGGEQVPAAAASAAMALTHTVPAAAATRSSLPAAGTSAARQDAMPSRPQFHLELKVGAPSWIEVYGPEHERLYYNLAAAGDTLSFDRAHGPFTVFLGNAGAVQISLNGKPVAIPASDRSGKTARLTVGSSQTPAPSPAS